ncbi:ornithine cyclodeaminase family protein [Amorphus orientalis]|uniref:Ornithine cyclodeaminase n=1 Tax=Amorphus orientalis TaxID=649198 RepID=A0AAE3VK12_9HYPH|nr:ornithine cyclodeaminase family protein [Amorphus orientalis]MDQ0313609.1 ornithine cyclodeaminase [Amorphus orientalis]
MIVLSETDIAGLLPMTAAIDIVADAMITVSNGGATLPLRTIMPVGGANKLGMMPGAMTDPATYGIKLVCLFPDNPASGYSSHQGAMVLFEPEHGAAVAMMNAGHLTAVRTAAASGVATRALARADASVLAIVGTGEQAVHHLDAMAAVRPIREVRVVGRRAERAEAFVAEARARHPALAFSAGTDVRAAVDGAHIVCTVTSSETPVLFGDWIGPGTHVNAVGASVPVKTEIDTALAAKSALFADYRPSLFAQAGEVIEAIKTGLFGEDHVRAEIGEVLAGTAPGRTGDDEITLYRSLGIAAQDLACADFCYRQAQARGIGVEAPLD